MNLVEEGDQNLKLVTFKIWHFKIIFIHFMWILDEHLVQLLKASIYQKYKHMTQFDFSKIRGLKKASGYQLIIIYKIK